MAALGPADVGARVTLRRRLPEGLYGDVVGELMSWEAGRIVVRRRDGTEVTVDEGLVVAGRVVPDTPGPEVGDLELEEIAARGWPPVEVEQLGGWRLRASEGWTGRGNSVLPLADPGLPLDAALDAVTRWYAARDLPPRMHVPLPVAADLDAVLADHGWKLSTPTEVQVAPVRTALRTVRDAAAVDLAAEPDDAWLGVYRYRGGALPPVARQVLTGRDRVAFASVREGDAVLATGRAVVDDDWTGVTAVEVAPAARGHGLAKAIMRGLLRWGADNGARWAYLQVAEDNTAALGLYARLGFSVHHRYHYRVGPPP